MNKKLSDGLAIIMPNKKINLFVIFMLILGIISGCIFLMTIKDTDKDIIINGKIDVLLWVKTDCKNTAFIAHLDEVTSEGKAYHIRTSGTTIRHELPRNEKYTPGTPIRVIADMSDICYAILKGSRIRIDITSSDFPQYSVHSNQEGNWAVATDNKIAEQTILVGKQYPSCVKIPYLNV